MIPCTCPPKIQGGQQEEGDGVVHHGHQTYLLHYPHVVYVITIYY